MRRKWTTGITVGITVTLHFISTQSVAFFGCYRITVTNSGDRISIALFIPPPRDGWSNATHGRAIGT
jgi:hypothetical protein